MAKQKVSQARLILKPKRKRRKFPVEIWAGGSLIRILRDPLYIPIKPPAGLVAKPDGTPRTKKCDSYLVEHYDGSKRIRRRRSLYEKALALAEGVIRPAD
jgi:hypothetical protein